MSADLPTLAHHLAQAPAFLDRLLQTLYAAHPSLPTSTCPCDHICLRVETLAEYALRKQELEQLGAALLTETTIAGRPIATFRLQEPVRVHDARWQGSALPDGDLRFGPKWERHVYVVELPAPKARVPGKGLPVYSSGWEHAEFAVAASDSPTVSDLIASGEAAASEQAWEAMNVFMTEQERTARGSGAVEIPWDKRGMGRVAGKTGVNVDLRLDFPEGKEAGSGGPFSVKYHWRPLEDVITMEEAWKAKRS
ncbi:hypothetical protein DFJ73DRAFT_838969 [Zopfochytrium polystomum]|nr:hypothetical protein DFJ73DRAFT_838969 [Zopfochytrium polystomum]